jgi:hypothetical protein
MNRQVEKELGGTAERSGRDRDTRASVSSGTRSRLCLSPASNPKTVVRAAGRKGITLLALPQQFFGCLPRLFAGLDLREHVIERADQYAYLATRVPDGRGSVLFAI